MPYGGYGWPGAQELPKEMPYKGGGIPYGYQLQEKYNLGLIVAGAVLFALSYGITAYSANERPGTGSGIGGNPAAEYAPWDTLYVPITGPFAFSAYAPGESAFIYIFEGLAQATSVGLFLGGILRPKDMLIRNDVARAFTPTFHVSPLSMQVVMPF